MTEFDCNCGMSLFIIDGDWVCPECGEQDQVKHLCDSCRHNTKKQELQCDCHDLGIEVNVKNYGQIIYYCSMYENYLFEILEEELK